MAPPLHPHASACGKVILLGEHSVVYGHPALAAGLPRSIVLEATALDEPTAPSTLRVDDWDLDLALTVDNGHPVARAALEVLGFCDGPLRGWALTGRSHLPARAGLGSSAALTVALARLVLGEDAPIDEVVEASLAGERVFHGEPSGIDSQVAARGGVLRFVRGEQPEAVTFPGTLPLVVIPSGIPRSTADQVAKVRALHGRRPRLTRPILDALGVTVAEGIDRLQASDLQGFGEIMNVAHELLSALGVSSSPLDSLCSVAREHGAAGAKLTGAGGGGCVIALAPADPDPLLGTLRARGLSPFPVAVEARLP